LRLGIHTFTSGSLEKAALRAADLGAQTFQIFSASPRMWRSRPADSDQIRLLQAARERFDLNPMAIHVNYLVNLASLDTVIRAKSIDAFRGELERATAIGADYLVLHPGSYRDHSVEEGIAALVLGLEEAAKNVNTGNLTVLIENTVGAGCHLGARLEQLRYIRDLACDLTSLRIGFCLDTCHLHAAGFDIVTPAGLTATLRAMDEHLGLANVHMFHANDSKAPRGSRIDRHAHIGEGTIGQAAFRRILRHPKLRNKPFILETPIDNPGDDRRNLEMLRLLAK
jgi:deoxyribonuclease-4